MRFWPLRINDLLATARSLFYCCVTTFLVASLITYDAYDPSLNVASSVIAYGNIGGMLGAVCADFLLQALGWASIFIILTFLSVSISAIVLGLSHAVTTQIICGLLASIVGSVWLSLIFKNNAGGTLGMLFTELLNKYSYPKSVTTVSTVSLLLLTIFALLPARVLKHLCFNWYRNKHAEGKNDAMSDMEEDAIKTEKVSLLARLTNRDNLASSTTKSGPRRKLKADTHPVDKKIECISRRKFALPPISMLNDPPPSKSDMGIEFYKEQAKLLLKILQDFSVSGNIVDYKTGPLITLYEFQPAAGIKASRIMGLADDISRSMRALSTRIAVIPGKNALGIELPNKNRDTVVLKELLICDQYMDGKVLLPLVIGKSISGEPVVADLASMPHLLIAGTTGSGKSVAINAMILSLLYRHTPDSCKFIMIDPKMLELSIYSDIPHLLVPVVTEPKKAIAALKWAVKEMENRYQLISNLGARNISGYNDKIRQAISRGEILERRAQVGFDPDTGNPIMQRIPLKMESMPFIVLIVDEMADLMLVAGKEVEISVQRLAQMARAAGIHIILATQRPSVDVITGVIKANFPTRISFAVTSKIDSRTIINEQGAEQLLRMGDMLYMSGGSRIMRAHAPLVTDTEVQSVVDYWKSMGQPNYIPDIVADETMHVEFAGDSNVSDDDDQALYNKAVEIVKQQQKVSISYIQRQLRIGYNRSAIIVEKMEEQGIISTPNHSGRRDVLVE